MTAYAALQGSDPLLVKVLQLLQLLRLNLSCNGLHRHQWLSLQKRQLSDHMAEGDVLQTEAHLLLGVPVDSSFTCKNNKHLKLGAVEQNGSIFWTKWVIQHLGNVLT